MKKHEETTQERNSLNAESVARASPGQMTLGNMGEPTTFMRGLTQERRHSSAPNVTITSLHQIL